MDPFLDPSQLTAPLSGRMCIRQTRSGRALVGILHLPEDVRILEGAAYALWFDGEKTRLVRQAQDQGVPAHMSSYGMGDLMQRDIWPKPASDDVFIVRFVEAFPDKNGWTMFGISPHAAPASSPTHAWFDVAQGKATSIDPPMDAVGVGIGQILTKEAVWPDQDGNPHSLPQLASAWRQHYHTYHKLLAKSVSSPELDAKLEEKVAKDPILRELNIGRIDRLYCKFLAGLEKAGALEVDRPRSLEDHEKRNALTVEIFKKCLEESTPTPSIGKRPGLG